MFSMMKGLVAPLWILLGPLAVVALMTRVISGVAALRKKSLKGQVVLITGASSGIGESVAAEFYKRGAKVILSSRRQSELNRVKESLIDVEHPGAYPPAILVMDVSDLDSVPTKVEEAFKMYGRIDVVVNNAGVLSRAEVIESSLSVYQDVMQVNYFGVVALTMAVLPRMMHNKKGHIVAISSVQGRMAIPRRSAYAASKHAMVAFMDSLRAEVADVGVHVTCVHPGYVRTNIAHVSLTAQGDAYGQEDPNIEQVCGGARNLFTIEGVNVGYQSRCPSVAFLLDWFHSYCTPCYDPVDVANDICDAVECNTPDLVIAPFVPNLLIYLRTVFPALHFYIMKRIAKSENYY